MRRLPFATLAPLAAATLLAAAGRPALAQPAVAPLPTRPAVPADAAAPAPAAAPRTLATYRFVGARDGRLPMVVTVTDSAGRLQAAFRLRGDAEARPMLIEVLDRDLVLQGQTPDGPLTLRLFAQNDTAAAAVAGRWWLGAGEGELRGRVVR